MSACPHCTYEITPVIKPKKNPIYFFTFLSWVLSGMSFNQWMPHTGQGFTSIIIAIVVNQILQKILVNRYCPLCEKEIVAAKTPEMPRTKEEQLNKRLSEFEKYWFEHYHCELPDVARNVILEDGSRIAALKAAKKAIGESDTLFGAFKTGLRKGLNKEKDN